MSRHSHLYKTASWQKRRLRQLAEHPLCSMCLAMGKVNQATVADHVEPHRGDLTAFTYGELQSLCATCHSRHKQRLEATGRLAGSDTDGNPLDQNSHWYK